MFGLDEAVVGLSDGTKVLAVLAVAVLLGLRHATDPDHLAAVSTLLAGGRERGRRAAARLGLAWGLGHACSLVALGLPAVLFKAALPDSAQRAAEAAVGTIVVLLAVWLLVRWRRGALRHAHLEPGPADGARHVRLRAGGSPGHRAAHRHHAARTPLQAFGVGLVHGIGGSAGFSVLLLSSIADHGVAVAALLLFSAFTAVSMALVTGLVGSALGRAAGHRCGRALVPALGAASLCLGGWYALGALDVVPYVL